MIAKVDGVMNGISVVGDRVGETMYYGPGAGGDATASAVIADLIDIARDGQNSPMLGFKKTLEGSGLSLLSPNEIYTKYYIRMKVVDKIGVLAGIANILGNYNISINSFLQKPDTKMKDYATLLFSTHECKEENVQAAMKELEKAEFSVEKPVMIRIED